MTTASYLGKPTSRVDGPAKVTGVAKYAAEYNVPGLAYGFVVTSAIAKGRIKRVHTADALAVEGVLEVFTHANRPPMAASYEKYGDEVAPPGSPFRPLYDDRIHFNGQPVALVVAEAPEIARFAASLIRLEYEQRAHVTDFEGERGRAAVSKKNGGELHSHRRGNVAKAFAQAEVRVEAEYRMPVEHHNPMEMFGATVVWEGDGRITVYDKTQGAAELPGLHRERLRNAPRQSACVIALCRGRIWIRLASAIRTAARGAGSARAAALSPGHPHTTADVHAWLSVGKHPVARAWS